MKKQCNSPALTLDGKIRRTGGGYGVVSAKVVRAGNVQLYLGSEVRVNYKANRIGFGSLGCGRTFSFSGSRVQICPDFPKGTLRRDKRCSDYILVEGSGKRTPEQSFLRRD